MLIPWVRNPSLKKQLYIKKIRERERERVKCSEVKATNEKIKVLPFMT